MKYMYYSIVSENTHTLLCKANLSLPPPPSLPLPSAIRVHNLHLPSLTEDNLTITATHHTRQLTLAPPSTGHWTHVYVHYALLASPDFCTFLVSCVSEIIL